MFLPDPMEWVRKYQEICHTSPGEDRKWEKRPKELQSFRRQMRRAARNRNPVEYHLFGVL